MATANRDEGSVNMANTNRDRESVFRRGQKNISFLTINNEGMIFSANIITNKQFSLQKKGGPGGFNPKNLRKIHPYIFIANRDLWFVMISPKLPAAAPHFSPPPPLF